MLTTVPNYRLWVDEVNKAGGLMLKKYNKRIPIEVTEIDDRSSNEDMVRLVERLMTVDKVDIVLSPWGTGPNLQAAPVFAKNGYPQLVGTGNSDKIPELVQRFPSTFWFLGMPSDGAKALVELLSDLKQKGQINDKVALFVVQHPFGSEFVTPTKPLLEKAGFKLAYETTYPLGVSDLSAQIKAAKAAAPDTMVAFSYPPDTFMLTEQSIANDFQPESEIPERRRRLSQLQGQVRRQGERHLRPWRLEPQRPRRQGLVCPSQSPDQPGAGPLGQLQHLCLTASPAAGDRAGW